MRRILETLLRSAKDSDCHNSSGIRHSYCLGRVCTSRILLAKDEAFVNAAITIATCLLLSGGARKATTIFHTRQGDWSGNYDVYGFARNCVFSLFMFTSTTHNAERDERLGALFVAVQMKARRWKQILTHISLYDGFCVPFVPFCVSQFTFLLIMVVAARICDCTTKWYVCTSLCCSQLLLFSRSLLSTIKAISQGFARSCSRRIFMA